MQAYISKIIPNDDAPDFPYIEVLVTFYDEVSEPHPVADVRVFLEKSEKTLPEVHSLALRKAGEFLERIVSGR